MKKFNYTKSNYYPHFTYWKPDAWDDGELIKYSYYFSICDWAGNELDGTESESAMFDKFDKLEYENRDPWVFVYPLKDDENMREFVDSETTFGNFGPVVKKTI